MKNWKKPISVLSATALLSGFLFSANVDASSAVKKVDVHYRDIKIVNNNEAVTIDPKTEPFLLNGTTYIPLRMMGELYNKTVQWSAATNTVIVKDKTTPVSQATVDYLNAQIKIKDAKILELENEIKKLKATQSEVDLDDLEDDLNDEYEDYYDDDLEDIEIFIGGDKDDIDVRVDVNADDWDDLSDREKEYFLQDIIDDILAKAKDADITGTVKDEDDGDLIASFEADKDGDLVFKKKSSNSDDLDDLEDELNDWYFDYYSDLDDVDITLDGDEDDIDITVEVNGDDWADLTDKEKFDFLEDIVDDILYEFEEAFIDGVVEDADKGTRLDTFYADGDDDGDLVID